MKFEKFPLLDIQISVTSYSCVIEKIRNAISKHEKMAIFVAAVHLIMECQKKQELKKIINKADIVTPDGMPLVWWLKLHNKKVNRVYGPDLMLKLCEAAESDGYRVGLLGGAKGQSQKVKNYLLKKFPHLKIKINIDTPSRPISARENKHVIHQINTHKLHILFVGLGCPYQEQWIYQHSEMTHVSAMLGVGAAFDFFSGAKVQAPKLIQICGLEWLFRFIQEPRRLWYRYVMLNTEFIYLVSKKIFSNMV